KDRNQFGQQFISFGMMKHKVANMATYIYVVESMSYRTAGLLDEVLSPIDKESAEAASLIMQGIHEYVTECSILKVKGSEMLDYVVDEAVQMYGGYGYIEDYPVERYYRDSRVARIYEGTNEINRMLIPGMLIKKAMKGELPLMEAAKRLQGELMEMPSMDDSDSDGLLAEEMKIIHNVKKVGLLTIGLAFQKFTTSLDQQQGVLGRIADIVIEGYSMESAMLRTQKIVAKGEAEAATVINMTRFYVYETIGKVDLWARELLAACAEGDELRTMLAALRRLTRHIPIDTLGLRQEIADTFIDKDKYEL
ncbi:MAG: acyl-CoA dehydrogenase, partial [Armatimonadetes bacterium]|nr:acyl-CoA dehydrogenase [Armatimonadota bacterium]